MSNNPNNPFAAALDTLTQRWGGWEAPLRVAGARSTDIERMRWIVNYPYEQHSEGQIAALHGHVEAALALPAFTFADLHNCIDTIEAMVKAYYAQGGDVSTSTAVRRARLSGKPSAEMIRFLLYCEKNFKKTLP